MLDRKTAGSMKNYEEYQDEELIRRLRDGDGSVMDYLMEQYKDLVRRKARSMYPVSYTHLDVYKRQPMTR